MSSKDDTDDIEIKTENMEALPVKPSLTVEGDITTENLGLHHIRVDAEKPYLYTIPRCMRAGCDEQVLYVRIRETDDPHIYELGYKCLRCSTFYVATVDTDITQWLFCAVMYNSKLKGMVEPKEVTDLGEAVEKLKEEV